MATSPDFNANNHQGYHSFTTETGDKYGSFYVYFVAENELPVSPEIDEDTALFSGPGWYWQAQFPGCMPDGEPMGPFNTSGEALSDANNNN